MTIDKIIGDIAVRIEVELEGSKNKILGSGVLWGPDDATSKYNYVFTAAHVIYKNKDSKLIIRYFDKEGEEKTEQSDSISIHCQYDDDVRPYIYDVAIIRIKKINTKYQNFLMKKVDQIEGKPNIIARGFPKMMHNSKNFRFSGKDVCARYSQPEKRMRQFQYNISNSENVNLAERNEELVGLSGMGVFLKDEQKITLIGIHSYGVGDDSPFNTVVGMGSELIIDICTNEGWDIPQYILDIQVNLSEYIKYLAVDIENDEFGDIMDDISEEDVLESIRHGFCGISANCKNREAPHRCNPFNVHLLFCLCILRLLNDNVCFKTPEIEKEGQNYPVKFICSGGINVEGINAVRVTMKDFILSLKIDYLKKNIVKDKSLIIWYSDINTKGRQLECSREEFKNIVPDIKKDIRKMDGFNIKSGPSQSNDLSIIHVNQIKKYIESNDNLESVKESILKVI
ncbi:hypothetical protein IZY60_04100 [Lutibacter sp. B2]|nr:hypothetical protein [Lutibacter sp. B2]